MSATRSAVVTAAAFVLLAASVGARTAAARASSADLPCTDSWTGPSASNEFDCSSESITNFLKLPDVIAMFVPAAIGILFLIPFCCVFLIGRYLCACCGSSRMRPSSFCGGRCCGPDPDDLLTEAERAEKYSPRCISVTKLSTILLIILAVAGVACSIGGGLALYDGARQAKPTVNRVADWAIGLSTSTKAAIADPSNPSSYPPGFDATTFEEAEIQIDSYRTDVNKIIDDVMPIIEIVTLIVAFVSIAPGLVLLLPAVAAVCNIRRCLPILFILLSYGFQFLYWIASSVFLIVFFAFAVVHSDLVSTNPSQKSLVQWYMIPVCDRDLPFNDAQQNIAKMEHDAAVQGCTDLLNVCSNNPVWTPGSQQVFYCAISSPATDCPDVAAMNAIVEGMHIKTGVPASSACGTATATNAECTIRKCATDCADPTARSDAAEAVDEWDMALRVSDAYNSILKPYMQCSALVSAVVSMGLSSTVAKLRDSSQALAAGAICLAIGLVLAVLIGFLGQKRFFNRDAVMGAGDGAACGAAAESGKMGQEGEGDDSESPPYAFPAAQKDEPPYASPYYSAPYGSDEVRAVDNMSAV